MFCGLDIIEVTGKIILDSRAKLAVEAEVVLENGAHGRASVTLENVKSAHQEREAVNDWLSEAILYEDASNQGKIDRVLLQAARNQITKSNGSFGVLALSMAVARAAGAGIGLPLYRYLGGTSAPVMPVPMMNMICAGDREKGHDFQELMVVPQGMKSYSEGIRMGTEIYHTLKKLLDMSGYRTFTGKDGGFVLDMKSIEDALHYLMSAVKLSGYKPGEEVMVAVNAGAGRLYTKEEGVYHFSRESRKAGILMDRKQKDMIAYYLRLADGFPICAVIDGLWKADLEGRGRLMRLLAHRVLMVSDDFIVSNGIVIKMKQSQTVTGALEMVEKARKAGDKVIFSSSFGDTQDPFLADMAAAVRADYIKCGAPCYGECTAKYNELLRIEEVFNKHG